jgi:small-conductance mechanosensitive channel
MTGQGASLTTRNQIDDKVKALLAAAEDAERRCKEYSRRAALLDKLSLALLPAFIVITIGLVAYVLYGLWQVVVTGLVFWLVGYVAYILRDVYSYRAAKAARQTCVYRHTAEIAAEIERIKVKLEKEIDELGQELERRKLLERIHAN